MAKSFVTPFPVIISGDMSGNIIGQVTDTTKQDNVAYHVTWSGSSLVGRFVVETTNDNPKNAAAVWTELIMDSPTTVPADSGDALFNINQNPGASTRFRYSASGGTGVLNVKVTAKGLG